MSGLQRQALETEYIECNYETVFRATRTVFQNEGYSVDQSDLDSGFIHFSKDIPEKNAGLAFTLGFLPGGGSFYVRSYGLGVCDILLYPWSVLWDPSVSALKASKMKKTVDVSCTLADLGEETELRTGFTGIDPSSEYGITLKRVNAEVRRQALMREGREQTPPERKK
jgi:hypothetical protein